MTRKKKKMTHRAKAKSPRDPFWRARRALGSRQVEGKKTYSRGATRAATRRSLEEQD
jgi:hypothetical protein